ncbi:hypothetical protein OEZ85_007226 [Tetradesmus obliquus]|uniref:Uncharacterized protein n=1 Tax=Tetradesmus obliquus TaxID=3088 RepID=A0ABY8TX03_TETOB|nr:hypothetical protein OEZ85_007226 [Tetradesmus obliquus]
MLSCRCRAPGVWPQHGMAIIKCCFKAPSLKKYPGALMLYKTASRSIKVLHETYYTPGVETRQGAKV